MLLTRLTPFMLNEWNRWQGEMNRLYENLTQANRPVFAGSYPAVNLWEDANNLYAEAELPGMTESDVEIYVEGDQLTIRGERKAPQDEGRWHRQERGFGKFQRTFTLPAPVNSETIEARLEHGVLALTLPKAEAARSRKITVKAE